MLASILLFYSGIAFSYYAVIPLLFQLTTNVASVGVSVMTDISRYLDFVLKLFCLQYVVHTAGYRLLGATCRAYVAALRGRGGEGE